MAKVDIEIKMLRKWIRKCEDGIPKALKECLEENTEACYSLAKQLCPVDTGHLQGSIYYEMLNGGTVGKVATNAHYARYVEQGTMFQMAQPYMKPAYFAVMKNIVPQMKQILQDFLNESRY